MPPIAQRRGFRTLETREPIRRRIPEDYTWYTRNAGALLMDRETWIDP